MSSATASTLSNAARSAYSRASVFAMSSVPSSGEFAPERGFLSDYLVPDVNFETGIPFISDVTPSDEVRIFVRRRASRRFLCCRGLIVVLSSLGLLAPFDSRCPGCIYLVRGGFLAFLDRPPPRLRVFDFLTVFRCSSSASPDHLRTEFLIVFE